MGASPSGPIAEASPVPPGPPSGSAPLELLPGSRRLLELHARELPQRDDLCGAFCGSLALRATGIETFDGQTLDQDAVALAAGSVVSASPHTDILPFGERGRRDYSVAVPTVEDQSLSGTSAAGLLDALGHLGGGAAEAIPLAGPWSAATLDALFRVAAASSEPVVLIANHHTGYLWGSHPSALQLADYLCGHDCEGPPPDWRVGHFACVVGRLGGARGRFLYLVADTYPALGDRGVHLQPSERLAASLQRREHPSGGIIVLAPASAARALERPLAAIALERRIWDNGSAASPAAPTEPAASPEPAEPASPAD